MSAANESPSNTNRLPEWEERLAMVIGRWRDTPHIYGESDCCIFAAEAVEAIIGVDLLAPWRGRYDSALSASRILAGSGGLSAIMDGILPRRPVSHAQRGDIVLVRCDDGIDGLAVVGTGGAWIPGGTGLVRMGVETWLECWAIG